MSNNWKKLKTFSRKGLKLCENEPAASCWGSIVPIIEVPAKRIRSESVNLTERKKFQIFFITVFPVISYILNV